MAEKMRLLLVEDSEDDEAMLLRALRQGGLEPGHVRVETEADLKDALGREAWDMVISDYSMPHFDGISAFKVLRASGKDIPFIFVSGQLGEEIAVEAMRLGASDYFTKGNLKRLVPAVQRELQKMEDRRRRSAAEAALATAEAQLRQAQKMEALGRLAGGVSHDFNNLLTVMTGYLALMQEAPDDQALREQGLAQLKACVERAGGLIRQLLTLSRRQPQERQPVALNEVVSDVCKMLERIIGEQIQVQTRLEPALPPVFADRGQMEQVLLNLAINARDAMAGGGRLLIGTGMAELDAAALANYPGSEPGHYAQLWVQDAGSGMDAAVMEQIFEPFFTTKPEGVGTGLGLSTVYGIVRQHQGHVSVESAPGQGSCFRVWIPVAGPAVPARIAPPRNLPLKGTELVLLVEDEVALRSLLRASLSHFGFQVLDAPDPEAALLLAADRSVRIDLLLTDLTMPKMDGRELARRFAVLHPEAKILFMTGYAAADQDLEGMPCLHKPFSPSDLTKRVRTVLEG